MRRIIALLMFPYFVPLVTLSVVSFAYMLATPAKPSDGTGPAGSDVLGLYFIGICIILGGALQIVAGLPLNALMSRLTRFGSRLTTSVVSVLIPVALFIPVLLHSSPTLFQGALAIGVVVFAFGSGAWFVSSTLKKAEPNNTWRANRP